MNIDKTLHRLETVLFISGYSLIVIGILIGFTDKPLSPIFFSIFAILVGIDVVLDARRKRKGRKECLKQIENLEEV